MDREKDTFFRDIVLSEAILFGPLIILACFG
jgi:hypothetical protein